MITLFAKELDKPQRNIPLALGGSVIICLIIYLMLQVSFLGAIDAKTVSNGWHTLDFTSPLSQLAVLLGINWLSLVLYVDAVISPSGTGIVYVGSSARIFTGMAEDKQMPSIFAHEHPVHHISRLSIFVTLVFCTVLVIFFDNWDKIMIVVSVFQILSCIAVPIAFSKIRADNKRESSFRMPFGLSASYITYMILSYLLVQCGTMALLLSFVFHILFFIIYCSVYYKNFSLSLKAIASSWSIFIYIGAMTLFGMLQEADKFNTTSILIGFFIFSSVNFYFLVKQKSYNKQ
jgi:amino acid transporter